MSRLSSNNGSKTTRKLWRRVFRQLRLMDRWDGFHDRIRRIKDVIARKEMKQQAEDET